MFDNVLQDSRYAIRALRSSPGFAAVAVLSLALGIGGTATVFSVVYGALINPYPYRGADRMVRVRLYGQSGSPDFLLLSARQSAQTETVDKKAVNARGNLLVSL